MSLIQCICRIVLRVHHLFVDYPWGCGVPLPSGATHISSPKRQGADQAHVSSSETDESCTSEGSALFQPVFICCHLPPETNDRLNGCVSDTEKVCEWEVTLHLFKAE